MPTSSDLDLATLRSAAATSLAGVIAQALSPIEDEQASWQAARLLQACDPEHVWKLFAPLATHDDPRLRELVPDTLRYLGGAPRPLLDRSVALLATMLAQPQADGVIAAIAAAFVDLDHRSAPTRLRPFVSHPNHEVRLTIVRVSHSATRHRRAQKENSAGDGGGGDPPALLALQ